MYIILLGYIDLHKCFGFAIILDTYVKVHLRILYQISKSNYADALESDSYLLNQRKIYRRWMEYEVKWEERVSPAIFLSPFTQTL